MQLHKEERMQLLFTTHESSIMDQSIFRRDEIWFIERNSDNASAIYSLDRFKERYDKVLSKAYMALFQYLVHSILCEQRVRQMCLYIYLTAAVTVQKGFPYPERRNRRGSC